MITVERVAIVGLLGLCAFFALQNQSLKNSVVSEKNSQVACNNSIEYAGYLTDLSLKASSLELDRASYRLDTARIEAKGIGELAYKEIDRLEALGEVAGDADLVVNSLNSMIDEALRL